jgi:uncharacterized repeat protein (TIGR01451 family)
MIPSSQSGHGRRRRRGPALEALEARAVPATFTVTTIADSGPGSLRQAISDANATSGTDTIDFNIPGTGLHTIAPASPLPAVTDAVTLDGYTQPGSRPNSNGPGLADNAAIMIELSGANAGPNAFGLQITAAGCTVRGLAVDRFTASGVYLAGAGGDRVQGCFIGTDPTGTQARPDREGILVVSTGNTIGGTTPDARGLISGNRNKGVLIAIGGSNIVQGCFIGTDATGTRALGNAGAGVAISSSASNRVGGTDPAAGDLISGNQGSGIAIDDSAPGGAPPTGNAIQGCLIGTDLSGTRPLGNSTAGVSLVNASQNAVGGTDPGAGNVIASNGSDGVSIQRGATGALADGNIIQGDSIGTDATGHLNLGNGGNGVDIDGSNNQIGGTDPAAGDTIGFNGRSGVVVEPALINPAGTGNSILSDSIHDNARGLGIDLNDDGPTPPPGSQATGPGANNNQSPPVLSTSRSGGGVNVTATIRGAPNTRFTVQFFSNASTDPDEGGAFLRALTATTDGSGTATIQASFAITGGQSVNATATDQAGNTSEFSFLGRAKGYALTADLSVRVAGVHAGLAGPVAPSSMETCTYVVSVTNNDPTTPADKVFVSDGIPAGYALMTDAVSQGQIIPDGTQKLRCDLGTLNPGKTATLTVVVQEMGGAAGAQSTATATANPLDPNATNSSATGAICPSQAGDYNGDGKTDFAIYDQTASQYFILFNGAQGALTPQFGNPSHVNIPVAGDYNGDGKTDIAIYDQASSQFFVLLSGGGALTPQFGNSSHRNIPVAGDFDGDGKTDIAIYDQTSSQFFIFLSGGGARMSQFGNPAHVNIPVGGDFDGDGKTDIAIYDQTSSQFFIFLSSGGASTPQFGNPAHLNIPIPSSFGGNPALAAARRSPPPAESATEPSMLIPSPSPRNPAGPAIATRASDGRPPIGPRLPQRFVEAAARPRPPQRLARERGVGESWGDRPASQLLALATRSSAAPGPEAFPTRP